MTEPNDDRKDDDGKSVPIRFATFSNADPFAPRLESHVRLKCDLAFTRAAVDGAKSGANQI